MPTSRTTKKSSTATKRVLGKRKHTSEHFFESSDSDDPLAEASDSLASAVDDNVVSADSQNAASTDAAELDLKAIFNRERAERERRADTIRSNINKSYAGSLASAQTAINTLFDEHEEEASRVFNAHLKRLFDLNKRKLEIEAAIAQRAKVLRQKYMEQVDMVLEVVKERQKMMQGSCVGTW